MSSRRTKVNSKKSSKPPKASMKETMIIFAEELVRILGKSRLEGKKTSFSKETTRKCPTLKELQERKYPFPDSDLSGMLNDLLENKIIELPEPKRPEEAGRTNDPKYYRYHRVISHHLEKCTTLKERIMQLAKDERIILDLDETAKANSIGAQLEPSPLRRESHTQLYQEEKYDSTPLLRMELFTIQFRSLEPVVVPLMV